MWPGSNKKQTRNRLRRKYFNNQAEDKNHKLKCCEIHEGCFFYRLYRQFFENVFVGHECVWQGLILVSSDTWWFGHFHAIKLTVMFVKVIYEMNNIFSSDFVSCWRQYLYFDVSGVSMNPRSLLVSWTAGPRWSSKQDKGADNII